MEESSQPPVARRRAVLLLGPTGAGKTPLGAMLEQRGLWGADCLHFDFGATLREIVRRNQPDRWISAEGVDFLRDVLQSGALLEDEHFPLARRILERFLSQRAPKPQTRIVLNGLPRHTGQARALDAMLDVEAAIQLVGSSETIWARIQRNVGGDRAGRQDDQHQAVRRKLAIFRQRTAPLLEHYRRRGARIDAIQVTAQMTSEEMWELLHRGFVRD
jgi:adenylate kinase family enzyme